MYSHSIWQSQNEMTPIVTLTHTLVVMKDPAGFAGEALVVLWARAFPT